MSWIVQMLGWSVADAACASRRNRCLAFSSSLHCCGQELQRDETSELRIARLIDDSHRAAANAGEDLVLRDGPANKRIVQKPHDTSGTAANSLRLGGEDDLADMLARLHQAMGGGSLGQRKRLVDDWLDDALFEGRPHVACERGGDRLSPPPTAAAASSR